MEQHSFLIIDCLFNVDNAHVEAHIASAHVHKAVELSRIGLPALPTIVLKSTSSPFKFPLGYFPYSRCIWPYRRLFKPDMDQTLPSPFEMLARLLHTGLHRAGCWQ